MKVKIMQRSVYHKYAEVELEVPHLFGCDSEMQEYLQKNEHLYIDKIDKAIDESEFQFGSGIGEYKGMCEPEADSEWRFKLETGYGGHL